MFRLEMRVVPVNEAGRVIGEAHHRAKLTELQIDRLFELAYGEPPTPAAHIAAELECSRRTVRDILEGRRRIHNVAGHRTVVVKVPVAA